MAAILKFFNRHLEPYGPYWEKTCLWGFRPGPEVIKLMSNFNGHLLFQADRLSCSYLNPPGGTNFTLPVLILSLN